MATKIYSGKSNFFATLAIHGRAKSFHNAVRSKVDFVLYQHAEGNLSVIDQCRGPEDPISTIFLFF